MTLEAIVLGLIALAIGAAFTFWGFRFFLLLLPIWGFIFGFILGADLVTYLFNNGFLATATSWVVGFIVGILFAALSYLYYWFAIVWIGATAGYALGTGIMAWLTPNLTITTFIVGLVLAAIFAVIFIVLKLPKFLAIAFTSFGGAFAVMAGIALILGRVPPEQIHAGTVGLYVKDDLSWLWVGAAVLLGLVGFTYQWISNQGTAFVSYSDYRNPGMASEMAGGDDRGTRERPM
jgi:hypothetical protein